MPHDAEALAEMVVTTIKLAMAPVLERLAVAEAKLLAVNAVEKTVSDVRDRVLAVEAKAAPTAEVVDLSPVLERLAVVDSKMETHVDTRDRVLAIEAKSAVVKDDSSAARLDALEARVTTISERLSATELRAEMKTAETAPVLAALADLTKDVGAMRERVAVVEVRAQVPGPSGKDGQNGKDGADGSGWDDLTVTHDGERTFTIKTARGERVKDAGSFTVPVDIYRGVYISGKSYERGDGVTWAGSEWHCNEPTSAQPGEGSKAWTLKVKRGRDGKDGRDAQTIPVVSVGGVS